SYSHPGCKITQQYCTKQQGKSIFKRHSAQIKATTIKLGKCSYRLIQPRKTQHQKQPGNQPATNTVNNSHIQKRTTYIAISTTNQLDYLNFGTPAFNMQAQSIAHHQ